MQPPKTHLTLFYVGWHCFTLPGIVLRCPASFYVARRRFTLPGVVLRCSASFYVARRRLASSNVFSQFTRMVSVLNLGSPFEFPTKQFKL